MTIKFNQEDASNYKVELNGNTYGKLTFDDDQNVWVLWPDDIDDGVSYFEDLAETQDYITDELAA